MKGRRLTFTSTIEQALALVDASAQQQAMILGGGGGGGGGSQLSLGPNPFVFIHAGTYKEHLLVNNNAVMIGAGKRFFSKFGTT